VLPSPNSFHLSTRKPSCFPNFGSDSSLGVVQRLPLRRHMIRASTPVRASCGPKTLRFTPFGQELPPPDSFRPCRSSRLRRFSPLDHRRLVASCSRPWGSPRFGPVPPRPGVRGGGTRRCSVPLCQVGWRLPPVSTRSDPKIFACGAARSPGLPRGVITLRRFSLTRSRVCRFRFHPPGVSPRGLLCLLPHCSSPCLLAVRTDDFPQRTWWQLDASRRSRLLAPGSLVSTISRGLKALLHE